jgi:DNA ligase (NAD+)
MPERCPACGSTVVRETGEVAVRCPNRSCPAQLVESIKHFVSKGAMDIEGLGEETVELLFREGLLTNVGDIYDLRREDLVHVEEGKVVALAGFGGKKGRDERGEVVLAEAKRAQKLLDAIEASKERSFERVVLGLGIRHVGAVTARELVTVFPDIDALMAATDEDLVAVPGVGAVVAEAICQHWDEARNRETVEKLRAAGVRMRREAGPVVAGGLAGKVFVLTGRLATIARGAAQERIEALGGRVGSTVTKATDYVVVGEAPGSKLAAARRLGTAVLDEEAFLALLAEAEASHGAGGSQLSLM